MKKLLMVLSVLVLLMASSISVRAERYVYANGFKLDTQTGNIVEFNVDEHSEYEPREILIEPEEGVFTLYEHKIVIPASIDGYKVTGVGPGVFKDSYKLVAGYDNELTWLESWHLEIYMHKGITNITLDSLDTGHKGMEMYLVLPKDNELGSVFNKNACEYSNAMTVKRTEKDFPNIHYFTDTGVYTVEKSGVVEVFIESAETAKDVKVKLCGSSVSGKTAPIVQEGRVIVPFRSYYEHLGATVTWDNDNRAVIAKMGDTTIWGELSRSGLNVNKQRVAIFSRVQMINGVTYLPVEAFAESLGYHVEWDNANKTVNIAE